MFMGIFTTLLIPETKRISLGKSSREECPQCEGRRWRSRKQMRADLVKMIKQRLCDTDSRGNSNPVYIEDTMLKAPLLFAIFF